jgi:hypothetical protein
MKYMLMLYDNGAAEAYALAPRLTTSLRSAGIWSSALRPRPG